VGVGISGREGLQAARAADYSVARFKHLKKLMLVHGRYSYMRTAFIAQYSFHKSMFFALIQLTYAVYNGYSGTSLFNSISVMTYNVFYTGFPVLFYALEQDMSFTSINAHPYLYREAQLSRLLNRNTMTWWFLRALYQGMVVFFFTFAVYNDAYLHPGSGHPMDYRSISMVAYTSAIFIQLSTIAYETHYWTYWNHIMIWGSGILYFVLMSIYGELSSFESLGVMRFLYSDPSFWLTVLVTTVAAFFPVLALKYWFFNYDPTPSQEIMALERQARKKKGLALQHYNFSQPSPADADLVDLATSGSDPQRSYNLPKKSA
jgi:magnesium-transporting ATPase (P-type)